MPGFQTLFPTRLYSAEINPPRGLAKTCLPIAAEDKAGQRWAREAWLWRLYLLCLAERPDRAGHVFAELERAIAGHVAAFARKAEFDLAGENSSWTVSGSM